MKHKPATLKKRFFLNLVLICNFSFIATLDADENVQAMQDVDPAKIMAYQGDVFLTQAAIDEEPLFKWAAWSAGHWIRRYGV